ncbi:FAD-dependent oxidoreductase [Cohnella sp. GCM10012308]|uniref:FAD-dependent oxidoreductase n=1 Tax=Cohnella sp. GCM10012308 TaxID=3317329 RepID=UPI0036060897
MKKKTKSFEVVVCGGGTAGFCAAVAAARQGARTVLIQDRPVFGGNSSSEIRVTPHGAAQFHAYARETGIISELLIEERARNHEVIFENGWTNSVWDMTMYDMAMNTPNLTFYLNTSILSVAKSSVRRIESVTAYVAGAETEIVFMGDVFLDCTGDGVVAEQAGCEWRMGTEGKAEFGEPHAPEAASQDTMGNSIHFKAKDMGRPVPFQAPDWAIRYEDADFFYKHGRQVYDIRGGYWWLEIGVPWHTIYDAEDIRHELTRHTLGVWDWIKNRDPLTRDKAANFALDWIGQVPGKRESRRIMGQYLMTEHDPIGRTAFPDEIAYGGWFLDLHTPGGLLAANSEPASAEGYDEKSEYAAKSYCGPYGIPLRISLTKDIDNLMTAGRNVSVTHAALGTVRVMSTTALIGQAVGTAAAVALRRGIEVKDAATEAIGEIQQRLLRDGVFLPNVKNEDDEDLARSATVTASSEALCYGVGPESPWTHGALKGWEETPRAPNEALEERRGQWIALGGGEGLRTLSLCMSNDSGVPQPIEARLYRVTDIWDYRVEPGAALAASTLTVQPGNRTWVDWPLKLTDADGLPLDGYVRVDVLENASVRWHVAGDLQPGHPSAFQMSANKMRRYGNGHTLCFKTEPPQACYSPEQAVSGCTRPHLSANVWRSDPNQPLSQWLQLEWDEERRIGQVELTFPGNLLREYHHYPPYYRDPQTAKDYTVELWNGGAWRIVVRVEGNYQRTRKHALPDGLTTSKLRIVVHATNGDSSAAIAEVRVYA